MFFELEAVFAKKGDALILHCGDQDDPRWLLIDGGTGVWGKFLQPRLEEIRDDWALEKLPLDLVMVSHIDDDHINGILPLIKSIARDSDPPYKVGTLWHNAFDLLTGTGKEEIVGMLEEEDDDDEDGGIASVRQGVKLTDFADEAIAKGRLTVNGFFTGNDDFPALIISGEDNTQPFALGETGVTCTVLAPNVKRLRSYQKRWDKEIKRAGLDQDGAPPAQGEGQISAVGALNPNDAFTFEDESPFNLASIVVLAERGGKTMLLTGDATGADIVEGLVIAGHLPQSALLDKAGLDADKADPKRDVPTHHVDLLKIPHHGSPNNVTTGFFRRVTADHYVVSGNGDHGNPNPHTFDMLREARGDAEYTIHFTLTEKEIAEFASSKSSKIRDGLERLHHWIEKLRKDGSTNIKLAFREDSGKSISVDLSS